MLSLLVALCGAPHLAGAAAPAVVAHGPSKPLRLGIVHVWPRLCRGQEPAQRDLRVLRLAFGIGRSAQQRREGPWYLRRIEGLGAAGTTGLTLDTLGLWDTPLQQVLGAHPDFAAQAAQPGANRLAAWQSTVLDSLSGASVGGITGLAAHSRLSLALYEAPAATPFLVTEFARSELLPYRTGLTPLPAAPPLPPLPPAPPAPPRPAAPLALDNPDAAAGKGCRDWPQGVTFEPGSEGLSYTLTRDTDVGAPRLVLQGYRQPRELWRDYRSGRLDAVLLEGVDLTPELRRYRPQELGRWALEAGTQQIVLRLGATLEAGLDPALRGALSQALSRQALSSVEPSYRFGPARGFLAPLLSPGEAEQAARALGYSTLQARRVWLKRDPQVGPLSLAVLAHPTLEHLAAQIQDHLQKTLNMTIAIQVEAVDQYHAVLTEQPALLRLEVLDMDSGSLQALWRQHPPQPSPGRDGPLLSWEAQFAAALPYIPLLENRHYLLVHDTLAERVLPELCPDCAPMAAPYPAFDRRTPQVDPNG